MFTTNIMTLTLSCDVFKQISCEENKNVAHRNFVKYFVFLELDYVEFAEDVGRTARWKNGS